MLTEKKIKELWEYVNQGVEFPWPRSAKAQGKLSSELAILIGNDEINTILNSLDKNNFNIKLRNLISPKLNEGKLEQSIALANWIVRDWGGIKNGNEAIISWVDQLAGFEESKITNFVHVMGTKRISSWSKILAFSDPMNHAIYDARTAIALNCGLNYLGEKFRFNIPLSQNTNMIAARPILLSKHKDDERGYADYVNLLKSIAKHCELKDDILKVEMTLFANAPLLADRFVMANS